MRKRLRALSVLALLCLLCAPAAAQPWEKRFGGSGDERIRAVAAAQDGVFAVGYTHSTDGDLSMRTRSGQTGWAVRIGEDGRILWNYCSAHVGRNVMTHPFAHEDGTFSCMLYAEGEGSEWLRLDGDGRLLWRIALPGAQALCPHAKDAQAHSGIPIEKDGQPALAVICEHGDGTICCALMTAQGEIAHGALFEYGHDWIVRPLPDDSGRIALIASTNGGARVLFADPGSAQPPQRCDVALEPGGLEWVLDAVAARDGSVIFSGQLSRPAGVLARVNAQGELLFCEETDDIAMHLAMTSEGFVCATSSQLLSYDEDGVLLGAQDVDALYMTQQMAAVSGGVMLFCGEESAKARQIAVRFVPDAGDVPKDGAPADNVLYLQERSEMLAAQPLAGGVGLCLALEDGTRQTLLVDHNGQAREIKTPFALGDEGFLPLWDGGISLEAVYGGVQVARVDAQGEPLFVTRTMINTAADTLQWHCAAALEDGSVLLGGRYLTGSGGSAGQQGVIARLGGDGVLREMTACDQLGAVCAILSNGEQTLLLASRGRWAADRADVVLPLSSLENRDAWRPLSMGLEQKNAALLRGADGDVLAAGTHLKNGAQSAVIERVR